MNFFAQPDLLFSIPLVLGVLILVYFKSRKVARLRLAQLIASKLLPTVVPHFSRKREGIKIAFFFAGIIFLLLSLAGPQWGFSKRTVSPKGIDILIAVDLSKSMLARDVRPNRLERVKLTLSNLLDKVKGDRLGLIAFSGSAFLQCPLTLDHQAFVKTLDELKVGLIPRPGTNLARPIQEAERSFSKDDTDKFLVLISDGEDLEGQGLMQAKETAKKGIRIFTIGIGSNEGARIPTDPLNQSPQKFLKDRAGTEILTKLDANALGDIARSTGGQYLPIGPTGEGLTLVFSELQTFGQKRLREQLSTTLPINRYQIFVILGILFLVIENLSPSSKKNVLKAATKCFPVAILLMIGCTQPDNVRRAEEATLKGDHLDAARLYANEIGSLKDDDDSLKVLRLNAGLSYLEAGSFQKAEEFLQLTLQQSTDNPDIQSKAINALGNLFYARANSFLDQQNIIEARKSWEKARGFYSAASQIDGNPLAE
ncbi:VWA domain-containing protein, partial [bacterium]|nr:VWA domain-containing protein [bacterium]